VSEVAANGAAGSLSGLAGVIAARHRLLGLLLLIAGAAAILFAALVDVILPGGTPGIGSSQAMLALLGFAAAAQGHALARGHTAWLEHWVGLIRGARPASLVRYGVILGQVALFVVAARLLQIESPAFFGQIVPLAAFGFVVHHVLPRAQQLAFFAALSIGGIVVVAGAANAAWIVTLVLLFLAICYLPLRFGARLGIVLALSLVLALMRGGVIPSPFSGAVWPIVASLLMFRLIVFLYDLRHASERPPAAWSLSYFFLLPNVVFTLFPVVDFATFRRTWFDRDPHLIYQRGLDWLMRGITHILLYRIVYRHFTLSPGEVETLGQLTQYVVTTFLLYLKVSGQFHIIVGLLHLFGFRLPETNQLYYLASSFSDAWRRINIYWKEFMTKVVFYPTYLRFKDHGERLALVAATAAVFVTTWFLHSYQWYWLLGTWLISSTDVMFWTALGFLLAINSLREVRHGRTRIVGKWTGSLGKSLGLGLRTSLTFLTIALLWSLWNSATLGDWVSLLRVRITGPRDFAPLAAVFVILGGAAIVAARRGKSVGASERKVAAAAASGFRPIPSLAGLAAICVLGMQSFGNAAGPGVQRVLQVLRVPELSTRDRAVMERGYYENLMGVAIRNSELWELYAQRAARGNNIWNTPIVIQRNDFLATEMRPSHTEHQPGITFSTNRWGMRDRDYEQARPAGTYRIALLGQSHVAGDGVGDGRTFEALVEERLNRELAPRSGVRYEILNFGIGSYSIEQQLLILDRVLSFQPDAVYFVGTPGDPERAALHIVNQIRRGVRPPWPVLDSLVSSVGVVTAMAEVEAMRRLEPLRDRILAWGLAQLAQVCRERGVLPVWVYLYLPERGVEPAQIQALEAMARQAGFETFSLADVYDGHDLESLWTSPFDHHPGTQAHELIAERLFAEITARPELNLPRGAPRAAPNQERQ
jgi:hypothetical protein